MIKKIHWLLPVIAMALAAVVLGKQHQDTSRTERENIRLRKVITSVRQEAAVSTNAAEEMKKQEKTIDWKGAAKPFADMRAGRGMGDMRVFFRLQEKLLTMESGELIAALNEVTALDLPKEDKRMLMDQIYGVLAQESPELVFQHLEQSDMMGSETRSSWALNNALGEWAKKDPAAAGAWLDRMAATGMLESKTLEGKNSQRVGLEAGLIAAMLQGGDSRALQRLDTLSSEQQMEVIEGLTSRLAAKDGKNDLTIAKLIREKVDPEKQSGLLADYAKNLARFNGYDGVTTYMDRIQANADERTAIVAEACEGRLANLSMRKKIDQKQVDEMRQWAIAQAPDSADAATGKALVSAVNYTTNELGDVLAIASRYHDEGAGDEVLVPLLESWEARQNKELALPLVEKIRDEKIRERLLKQLK